MIVYDVERGNLRRNYQMIDLFMHKSPAGNEQDVFNLVYFYLFMGTFPSSAHEIWVVIRRRSVN